MNSKSIIPRLLICCSLLVGSHSLMAENVFITGWKGLAANASDHTPPPLSTIDSGFAPSGAGGASASQVSPTPVIPNNARRIHYGRSVGATWTLIPYDMTVTPSNPTNTGPYTFTALQNIGVYKIYLTKGQDNNASTNIIVKMTAFGGELADTNGVGSAEIFLDMYQKGKPNHVWVHVGYITNSTYTPTIILQHDSGEINDLDGANNNAQRWYTDAIRFEFIDQCAGVANEVAATGPLVQGQQFVNVTGVAAGATNVTVYANNAIIGQTNFASGFAAGALTVPTSALVKGQSITAGQTKDGCTSLVPTTGPRVGSGANGTLRAYLSLWSGSSFNGPLGANTSAGFEQNYFLKAGGFVAGFGTAPTGSGGALSTNACWQTITFDHGNDSAIQQNGNPFFGNTAPYCALDGLIFSIVQDESGPYDLFIDEISNGENVIEGFEGLANGASHLFNAPSGAAAPSPASTYVGAPNSSSVSHVQAYAGTNSLRVQWQWTDGNSVRWARVPANMTNSSRFFPQLDWTKPIKVRYLLLPAGESTSKLSFPVVPLSQTKGIGQNATFSVSAVGQGLSYQWYYNDGPLFNETSATLTVNNVQLSDAGKYSVVVSSTSGCSSTLDAYLTVSEVIAPPTLNYSVAAGQITFTWEGDFTLQSATQIDGTFENVSGSSGYQENLNSAATKFFRLRQ